MIGRVAGRYGMERGEGLAQRSLTGSPAPVGSCSSPAEWAQQEYWELWAAFVERWCGRLEEEFASPTVGEEEEQLLTVADRPLTHRSGLACLSQFRQIGSAVPDGSARRDTDGTRSGTPWCRQ
ncbi:hypothetical protein [Streptomyces sp. NPDC090135]|uniref:hypothetical protein n=1 Tax=Streptomyces sp. NPDC090135 TaxID=3365957 RepID=UPI00380F3DA4